MKKRTGKQIEDFGLLYFVFFCRAARNDKDIKPIATKSYSHGAQLIN